MTTIDLDEQPSSTTTTNMILSLKTEHWRLKCDEMRERLNNCNEQINHWANSAREMTTTMRQLVDRNLILHKENEELKNKQQELKDEVYDLRSQIILLKTNLADEQCKILSITNNIQQNKLIISSSSSSHCVTPQIFSTYCINETNSPPPPHPLAICSQPSSSAAAFSVTTAAAILQHHSNINEIDLSTTIPSIGIKCEKDVESFHEDSQADVSLDLHNTSQPQIVHETQAAEDEEEEETFAQPNESINGTGPYECDICFSRYQHSSSLFRHRGKQHPGMTRRRRRRSLPIKLTMRKFPLNQTLPTPTTAIEEDDEEEEQPISTNLNLLNRSLPQHNSSDILNNNHHNISSTSLDLNTCDLCNKRYSDKYCLQRHVKTAHVNHYNNSSGGGASLSSSSIRRLGDKCYQCPACKKTFATRTNVRIHLRLHSGEFPYHCNFCNKKYNQKVNLMAHLKKHHSGRK